MPFLRRQLVGHTAFAGGFDVLDVLVQRAASVLVGRGVPGGAAAGNFGAIDGHVDAVGLGVDRDLVAVLHEGDGAAFLRLGRDVADDEAVRAAAEAAVGNQGRVGAEAGAHDGACRR